MKRKGFPSIPSLCLPDDVHEESVRVADSRRQSLTVKRFRNHGPWVDLAWPTRFLSEIGKCSHADRPATAAPHHIPDVRSRFHYKRIPKNKNNNNEMSHSKISRPRFYLLAWSDNLLQVIICWEPLDSC